MKVPNALDTLYNIVPIKFLTFPGSDFMIRHKLLNALPMFLKIFLNLCNLAIFVNFLFSGFFKLWIQ